MYLMYLNPTRINSLCSSWAIVRALHQAILHRLRLCELRQVARGGGGGRGDVPRRKMPVFFWEKMVIFPAIQW